MARATASPASPRTLSVTLRPIKSDDVATCGRIIFEAFKGIAQRHNFPLDFPSVESATELAGHFTHHPKFYGVVAESGGKVVGSNFLDERNPIRGVGPITVDPGCQQGGVGRRLMEAVLERGRKASGIRLVQDAFNMASYSLYASLGFAAKEPLVLMRGRPRSAPSPDVEVRPMQPGDVEACAALCERVHGFARGNELRDAVKGMHPCVAVRGGCIAAYASAVDFWPLNHGVAEREEDLRALLLGAGAINPQPLALLVPTRQANLFRWCLSEGLRGVKPMTLMAIGPYHEPAGAFFPSVEY